MTILRFTSVLATAAGLLFLPTTAEAQFDKGWKDWYGHFAAGWVDISGDAANVLQDGFNVSGGATYKPEEWPIGIIFEGGYNSFDMTSEARDFFEASGGDGSIFSATAGAIWSPKLRGSVGFAVSAGVGGYYIDASLTEPGYVCGPVCPPYWGWWCYWGCTPGNVVTDSASSFEFGFNIGALVAYELDSGSSIYLEFKWHQVQTEFTTQYMPVTIGFRF